MTTMFFGYNYGKLSIAVTDGPKPEKEDWREIDPATLDDDAQQLFYTYKEDYATMKASKAAFENVIRALGGIMPTAKATPKKAKNALSLTAFLADRDLSGHRS